MKKGSAECFVPYGSSGASVVGAVAPTASSERAKKKKASTKSICSRCKKSNIGNKAAKICPALVAGKPCGKKLCVECARALYGNEEPQVDGSSPTAEVATQKTAKQLAVEARRASVLQPLRSESTVAAATPPAPPPPLVAIAAPAASGDDADVLEAQPSYTVGKFLLDPGDASAAVLVAAASCLDMVCETNGEFCARLTRFNMSSLDDVPALVAFRAESRVQLVHRFGFGITGGPRSKRGARGKLCEAVLRHDDQEVVSAARLFVEAACRAVLKAEVAQLDPVWSATIVSLATILETCDREVLKRFVLRVAVEPPAALASSALTAWLVYVVNVDRQAQGGSDLNALRSHLYSSAAVDMNNVQALALAVSSADAAFEVVSFAMVMRPSLLLAPIVDLLMRRPPVAGDGRAPFSATRASDVLFVFDGRACFRNECAGNVGDAVMVGSGVQGSFWRFSHESDANRFVGRHAPSRLAVPLPLTDASIEGKLDFVEHVLKQAASDVRVDVGRTRSVVAPLRARTLRALESTLLLRMLDKERLTEHSAKLELEKQRLANDLAVVRAERDALQEELTEMKRADEARRKLAASAPAAARASTTEGDAAPAPSAFMQVSSGRELVDAIRQSRGVGFAKGSVERLVVDEILQVVGPAVKVLAVDMYSSASRCFFELLQVGSCVWCVLLSFIDLAVVAELGRSHVRRGCNPDVPRGGLSIGSARFQQRAHRVHP